jgi:hypothetical protein
MKNAQYARNGFRNAACVVRAIKLARKSNNHPRRIMGDSWFGSLRLLAHANALLGTEAEPNHFVMVIKTAHAGYPKKYLEEKMADVPSGNKLVMTATVNGVEVVALAYRYNRKKTLLFLLTKGAGSTAFDPEHPYVAKFLDHSGHNNERHIPRSAVLNRFFAASPRIDNHNQRRQHELDVAYTWQTDDCWFRFNGEILGITVVDVLKACHAHLPLGHPIVKKTTKQVASMLALQLVNNDFPDVRPGSGDGQASERPRKRRRRSSAQAQQQRPVPVSGSSAVTSAVSTPQAPLSQHTLTSNAQTTTAVKKGSSETRGRAKQGRCFWCNHVLNKRTLTTFHCRECTVKRQGVFMYFCSNPCFDLHVKHRVPGKFAHRKNPAWCKSVTGGE